MIKYARLMDALLLISFSIFFACSTDINPKANELYVAASKILDEAKNSTNNYMETFQLYAKARQKIDTIIQRYSSSNIAVSLMSGQSKISNLTLEEFKTLEHSLKYLADCDTNPLTCAVLLANKINDPFLLSSSLITIADAYDYVKYERKVIGLLSQAYNSALHITDEKNRIESLSGVAESYAKLGKTEKATRILSEALNIVSSLEDIAHISNSLRYILSACEKIGGTEGILALLSRMYPTVFLLINDDFYKPISFYELACTYTEIEQFDRAIQTALCIADEIWMSAAFSRISDKYVSSNQLEKALEIATKFSKKFSASDKIKNVILIADKYLESGQNTKASNLVFQALEIANSMEGQNSREKVEALTNISDKYILMGDKEKASEVLLLALGSV
ncbi:tetratricopeptide repeat protein, partial [Desulfatiglans anilini]|uniref:tetratricopeptide repeat protein n=1 Tax=Desulfatiglans anilini TaxID=90728 RepID=UPI0012946B5B